MADSNATESPLQAAAGAAGPHTIDAFELLANETRLAILLALWEAYESFASGSSVPFSELRERVGMRDSGNFNYHLGERRECCFLPPMRPTRFGAPVNRYAPNDDGVS